MLQIACVANCRYMYTTNSFVVQLISSSVVQQTQINASVFTRIHVATCMCTVFMPYKGYPLLHLCAIEYKIISSYMHKLSDVPNWDAVLCIPRPTTTWKESDLLHSFVNQLLLYQESRIPAYCRQHKFDIVALALIRRRIHAYMRQIVRNICTV